MDLNPTAEDRAFRQEVRRWLETNVPTGDVKTLDERKAWHRKLYEAGYVGMLWPKEYGGWGRTPMQQAIVQDEMARIGAPPPINGLGIGFIGPTIIVHGTDWQKERYLKTMLTAEEIWCQLYSEPNAGSDLASLKTRAEDQGDHFLVNGQKIWTSSGPIADWGIPAPSSRSSATPRCGCCRRCRTATPRAPRRPSPSSPTRSSRNATSSSRSRSSGRTVSSSPRARSSRTSTPPPASPARGQPRSSGRAPAQSTRAPRRSRRTSSGSACSACPRKCARTA